MKKIKINIFVMMLTVFVLSSLIKAEACSNFLYTGENNIVLRGRTADWAGEIDTNLWLFPRGIKRNGLAGKNSIEWTSKYGSVVASTHDLMTIDGVNEKGLSMAILRLKESEFIPQNEVGNKKGLGISLWGQYFLDNFSTVEEAINFVKKDSIYVAPLNVDNGNGSGMHLTLSDKTGNFVVFEYTGKKLHIYNDKNYKVVTNSPKYSDQMAINEYWNDKNFLPGTHNSSDRFVRAFYYLNKLPKTQDINIAVAYVSSLIKNISSPLGIKDNTTNKEESATLWNTITNHNDLTYYFQSVYKNYGFTIDLKKLNFDKNQSVKTINLTGGEYYFGDASDKFKIAKPFNFFPSDGQVVNVNK